MCVEINRRPATLTVMIPWVKSDRHLVLGSSRNRVPGPSNDLFDLCRFRFNEAWNACRISIHTQEFIGRIVVSHVFAKQDVFFPGPDAVSRLTFSDQNSSWHETTEIIGDWKRVHSRVSG